MQRCSAWVGLDRGKLSFLVKSFALRASRSYGFYSACALFALAFLLIVVADLGWFMPLVFQLWRRALYCDHANVR